MTREQQCLDLLLDPSATIGEKAKALAGFVSWYESVGRSVGLGIRGGRTYAYEQLFKALPKGDKNAEQKLRRVIDEVFSHVQRDRRKREDESMRLAKSLRSLRQGTTVLIRNEDREDAVRLIEVKRTRFVCEYQDGRRYSVPVQNFLGVSEDIAFEPPPDVARRRRELVRNLVGPRSEQARDEIVSEGVGMLKALLDELAAAHNRIENAPGGFSRGLLGASLGRIKKVSSRDQALTKQIPEVIAEIAEVAGVEEVRRRVEEHPDALVRDRCAAILDRLKR